MCGRYRLSRRKQFVEEYFATAQSEDEWNPRYNIAPTQSVPVIRQHPKKPIRVNPAEFSLCLRNGDGWADYCGDHLAKIVANDPRFRLRGHQIVSTPRDVLYTRFYRPLSNEAAE